MRARSRKDEELSGWSSREREIGRGKEILSRHVGDSGHALVALDDRLPIIKSGVLL
jgi:hypothetical protein